VDSFAGRVVVVADRIAIVAQVEVAVEAAHELKAGLAVAPE